MGGRVFRDNYKGHMDKTKGREWKQGRKVGVAGVGGSKCRQLYLNNKIIRKELTMTTETHQL